MINKVAAVPVTFGHVFSRRCFYTGNHFAIGTRQELELRKPVVLAGRKLLPSSAAPGMPKYLSSPTEEMNYPVVLTAQRGQPTSLTHWAKRSRDVIDEAYNLFQTNGFPVALLFRGLPIQNERDFAEWTKNLDYHNVSSNNITGLVNEIAENVSEGSLESNDVTIEPHNEQAYSDFHAKIFTICNFKRAASGGETAIADTRKVFEKIDKSLVEKCETKQLRYWQYLPHKNSHHFTSKYKSWQKFFRTDDAIIVEEFLRKRSHSFKWDNDNLLMWKNLPPFSTHAKTGERIWFNQFAANHCSYLQEVPMFKGVKIPNIEYPHHTTFGDGEEIDQDDIDMVRCAKWRSAVGFEWQDGDVLILDNLIMQHSRLSFEGERKVGISLLTY